MFARAEVTLMRLVPAILFALIAAATCAAPAAGQALNCQWRTIDGGGGASSSGIYALQGTIGQPDAGAAFGTIDYALTGGFWRGEQSLVFRLIFADGFSSGSTSAWSAVTPVAAAPAPEAAPIVAEAAPLAPSAEPSGG